MNKYLEFADFLDLTARQIRTVNEDKEITSTQMENTVDWIIDNAPIEVKNLSLLKYRLNYWLK